MRLVHLADLHLGYRAYNRLTKTGGINQREVDVSATFARVVDRVIEVAPDLIVIAGDVFDMPRPSNDTLVETYAQFSRLSTTLSETPIVIAAGNHDLSKARDMACALQLFANLDVCVADREAKRFTFPAMDLAVLAVPDAPGASRPEMHPAPGVTYNVLCIHGEAQGVKQGNAALHRSAQEIAVGELDADSWDYVALGHYHQYEEISPNAFYSGAIDFTSSNPWQEIATPKGFVEHNLLTGEHTFHVVTPSRTFVDLASIDVLGMGAEDVSSLIRSTLDDAEIDGKVVRLIVNGVSKEVAQSLDQKMLREMKARALNLRLDFRRPETVAAIGAPRGERAKRKTLDQEIADFLSNPERVMPDDVDRAAAIATARRYLETTLDPYTNESYAHEVKDSAVAA